MREREYQRASGEGGEVPSFHKEWKKPKVLDRLGGFQPTRKPNPQMGIFTVPSGPYINETQQQLERACSCTLNKEK